MKLIDAEIAYDKIAEQETSYYMDMEGVQAGLDETPTVDAVPVVRCGECKWARDYKGEMICGRVPLAIWTTMPERYCVDGERRSECD